MKKPKFQVYRNLHFRNRVVWSLKNLKSQRVESHEEVVYLKNVEYRVGPKGRERVVETGNKTVHAGACGEVLRFKPRNVKWTPATYNPKKMKTFKCRETGKVLKESTYAMLNQNGLFYGEKEAA